MASDHQMTVARTSKSFPPATMSKATRQVVPAFLQKLYEMVNDPKNSELIRWSEAGDSFFVLDHERFAHDVLGRWFKHRNFSSFVRQLNMYGFHKIPHLQQGVLKSDNETEFWNFAHPNFHRGQPDLLCLIQRKKTSTQGNADDIEIQDSTPTVTGNGQVLDVQSVINGITAIKRHQTTISAELNELKRSNELLWQDAMAARQRHQKQQDTINRILKFLAGVFGNTVNRTKPDSGDPHVVIPRRTARFMIEDAKRDGKNIVELDDLEMLPEDVATPISITSADDSVMSVPDTSTSPAPDITHTVTQPHPKSQTPKSQPQDTERAVTPRLSGAPVFDFDPRVQGMLNQLSQAQVQQLLNSLASQPAPDPLPSSSTSSDLPSSSHLTPYQPPPFDFSLLSGSNSGASNDTPLQLFSPSPPPVQTDGLISFNPMDHVPQERVERQWQGTEDIDRDVNALNTSIQQLIQTFGLDPNLLDSADAAALSPQTTSVPSAPINIPPPDSSTGGIAEFSPSLGPIPATDFDFDSFFNTLPVTGAPDLDYTDAATTAFLDEVPSPASTASPIQNLRHVSPEISARPSTSSGLNVSFTSPVTDISPSTTAPPISTTGAGRKRKSDVTDLDGGTLSLFQTVTPASLLPDASRSATAPADAKSKRRKEK